MIGKQLITLVSAKFSKASYNRIWKQLGEEAGSRTRFGDITSSLMRIRPLDWLWTRRHFEIHKFVIMRGKSEPIGVAVIERDLIHQVCSIVLGLTPENRGRKLGSVAARLLLRKCFQDFGAARVESSALSSNPASINMQDGMIHEGTLKERFVIEGQRVDELIFRLLRCEWESGALNRAARRPKDQAQ